MNVKAFPQLQSGIINNAKKCVFIRQRFFISFMFGLPYREKISLTIIKLESEIYHHTISHPPDSHSRIQTTTTSTRKCSRDALLFNYWVNSLEIFPSTLLSLARSFQHLKAFVGEDKNRRKDNQQTSIMWSGLHTYSACRVCDTTTI